MRSIVLYFILLCQIGSLNAQSYWESTGFTYYAHVYGLYDDTATNTLFIGGKIPSSGGPQTKGFAYFDDTGFTTIPNTILMAPSRDFIRYKGDLYVAGNGGVKIWHGGDSVSLPGDGVNGIVSGLKIFDDTLYAYGQITKAGGNTVQNMIAKWDGTVWTEAIASPSNAYGFDIAGIGTIEYYKGDLYIGGVVFDDEGNCSLLKWDGEQFTLPGNGVRGPFAEVQSMIVWNDTLYVAGLFDKIDGNAGNGIMKWDGTEWHDVGGGITSGGAGRIWKMKVIDDKLYAVGGFESIGGVKAKCTAYWQNNQWCALGGNFDNGVTTIEKFQDSIWVAGGFDMIGEDTIFSLSKWAGGEYTDTCGNIIAGNFELQASLIPLSVFPNPAKDELTLIFGSSSSEGLSIYNLQSQLIHQAIISSGQTIDISTIPIGVYIIRVGDEITRLVKQ